MRTYSRHLRLWAALGGVIAVTFAALFAGGYYYVAPSLPAAESLRDVRLQIPLSVYSRDGRLLAQFGERQRTPAAYDEIPERLVQAILAAEDDRFFEHPGFDYQGMLRAGVNFVLTAGGRGQGGSTITQQLARMYFLTRERTFVRKFKELILATRIEHEFTKQEILELYLNTYFFGQRAYGVVAAAQVYFGKNLADLNLSEIAIIAGIPPGPSVLNPIASPEAAARRRGYVLGRMRSLGFISEIEQIEAAAVPILGSRFGPELELAAPYVAEMVRAEVIRRIGPAAYEAGLNVTTTIDSRLQLVAQTALRQAAIEYDERHGYRGVLAHVDLDAWREDADHAELTDEALWQQALEGYPATAGFLTGLVVGIDAQTVLAPPAEEASPDGAGAEPQPTIEQTAHLYFETLGLVDIPLAAVEWAAPYIDDNTVGSRPEQITDLLAVGDIARFRRDAAGNLRLSQIPDVQGALVSLDPIDGGIAALTGGFDFSLSNFNRAIQTKRQPGSSFKPFIYSAALENGFTTATIVNDAPIVQSSSELETVWRPENYSGRFNGPTRLREALVNSLNLVSIRVVRDAGVGNVVAHIRKFGFDETATPRNLALALGAGGVAPIDIARGYATFANGGYRVQPYLIERIEDMDGNVLYEARPRLACNTCDDAEEPVTPVVGRLGGFDGKRMLAYAPTELYPKPAAAERVITAQNAFLVGDMMRDVVRRGTGRRAYNALGRQDLAGKTGTTNDRRDAWFSGFNGDLVTTTWIGFDQERPLGRYEEGSRTALPMWIYFMREALASLPEHQMQRPSGIVDVRINPDSGLVTSDTSRSVFEKFRIDEVPEREVERSTWQPQQHGEEMQHDNAVVDQPLF